MANITKRTVYEGLIEMADTGITEKVDWSDIKALAVKEIALLDDKKAKAKARAEKARKESDPLTEAVYAVTSTEPETLDTIAAKVEFDGEFSVSKIGACLRKLKDAGMVDKTEIKVKPEGGKTAPRVAYFRVDS